MADDAYMAFQKYDGHWLDSESQVDFKQDQAPTFKDLFKPGKVFEITSPEFGIEQTLNIGSSTKGIGAGKVTFNEFSITKKMETASTTMFKMACSGTPFQQVNLGLRKASGGTTAAEFFLVFIFSLVGIKGINFSNGDEGPEETITFNYGGICMQYRMQKQDGTFASIIPGGWNQVTNTNWDTATAIPA